MNEELLAELRNKLTLLEKMRNHLEYSCSRIMPWWRVDADFDAWDEAKLESLAAFKMRFSEMQDQLASAMRLIAVIEEEKTERFTYVLNYMVQLGVLDSMEAWSEVRTLRNAAAHDYSASEAEKALHFHRLLRNADFLFQTLDGLKGFVRSAYPESSGQHRS